MVAVRQFDEDVALQKIMEAFWLEGFQATSIDDLVAATGLKRGSLYAAFGDKENMFLLAYRRYVASAEDALLSILDAPGLETAMEQFFGMIINSLEDPATPPGCLIANSIGEVAGRGDRIEEVVLQSFARSESALYQRLLRAQAAGELPAGEDLRALARFFATTMRSVALIHRLTKDREIAQDVIKVALKALPLLPTS